MKFDEILQIVGTFGRWHKIFFLAIIPLFVVTAHHMVATVFSQATPNFRCRLPHENSNAKYKLPTEEMDKNYPIDKSTKTYSTCTIYQNGTNSEEIECDNYIYDDSVYKETVITLLNMVCSNAYLAATSDSCFMVGYLLGSFIAGWLSDRFGRKLILYISLVLQLVFSVWIIFSYNYACYAAGRFGDGAVTESVFLVAYVLVTELVVPKHRLYAGQAAQLAFACGYMLVGLHAYLIRHWRYLYAVLCAPGIIFLGYWFVVPESPRWLLSTKQEEAAMKVVKNIAKWNKVDLSLPENDISEMIKPNVPAAVDENVEAEKPAAKPTILDIFKHKRLRRNSIILFFGWFSIAMTYFGITYGSNNLYGDNFVMFGIGGVAEFIAYILVIFTVNVWGRKNLYCISMILSGVFLVCYGFVPEDLGWLASTIAMIGKLFNCYAYAVAYIYTVEVYPTVIRNAGLGVCSTIARIGTIIAPYINLTIKFWRPCPLLVMGVAILTSGFASLLLPETLNQKLPDTIEDGENFGLKPDNPVEN